MPPERPAVLLVGYFPGDQKDFAARMDAAADQLTARGARVTGRIVQRRGVSHGGVRKMALPLSPRTVLGPGKVREAAELRERTGAQLAVFVAPSALTERQRSALAEALGCPAVTLAEALEQDVSR
ncbi:hypothetical protein [Streptomyces sp. NPDC049879]|uniref:hypothetical protein n=1 Tax=Streptomyces sp. NPDC049879 TaxID=3365598 RepID=UPI0037ACBE32